MRCGEACEFRRQHSEMSPLISGPVVARSPRNQYLRFGEQQRAESVGFGLQTAISARSRASFLAARIRVRINRMAATTEKPSTPALSVRTANS